MADGPSDTNRGGNVTDNGSVQAALLEFAEAVATKMSQIMSGEPEDQLRAPFEQFMGRVARAFGWRVVCTGETPLPDRLGRPDYAVHMNGLLAGYVELKAPGTGANARRFKGRNREQFRRFSSLPNILYTDGEEWALYHNGTMAKQAGVPTGGENTGGLESLLREFLCWQPQIPMSRGNKVDVKGLAAMLAPLCRMLRYDVSDALYRPSSTLAQLAKDWQSLLFPEATNKQFADAYAQTVVFALLLGRAEGADPLTTDSAVAALDAEHSLLSRALRVLTDSGTRNELCSSLELLERVIGAVPSLSLSAPGDPWLYFYEDFLDAYDPELRRDAGAYYTPVQVVHAQVRMVDDLLRHRLGKRRGFADRSVLTLDPAAGTGTYLLGIIEHVREEVLGSEGPGAISGNMVALARNLFGFEIMVGPYAVAELRVDRALRGDDTGSEWRRPQIYLADTLESPHAEPLAPPLYLRPISEQHEQAKKVKNEARVLVCLGNPPYDRHSATSEDNQSSTGGWVRWGEPGSVDKPILHSFSAPAVEAGHAVHLKNLYNLYVYFWRWAIWKVFEHDTAAGPGIVSFISGSSYLSGEAFCGMREHLRRQCDEIWVIDLGGEGRGTRREENVFAIQTPVAIAIVLRSSAANRERPAAVHYARIAGPRAKKLAELEKLKAVSSVRWEVCPDGWQAPFRPAGQGEYFDWPLLTDLLPWQHSGCELKRTWPICHDAATLARRWRTLLTAANKAVAFRETEFRTIATECSQLFAGELMQAQIGSLGAKTPPPAAAAYAYRSFDRQSVLADSRLGDRFRPDLWRVRGPKQVFLTSLLSHPLGGGPALTASCFVPDLHHFRGSYGGKDAVPLYRDGENTKPNIMPALLDLLGETYDRKVEPEDFLAYVYGALAHPAYTLLFEKELETCEIRIPLTREASLFEEVRRVGARLLWLHTYGERFVPDGHQRGVVPQGSARCVTAVRGGRRGVPNRVQVQ